MLKKISYILIFVFIPWLVSAEIQPLQEYQAFKFNVQPSNTDSLIASWNIAPGYYLYKSRFKFQILSPHEAKLGKIFYPQGVVRTDGILGRHQVYKDQVNISIPVLNPTEKKMVLLIGFQGCSGAGFCYPPLLKQVNIAANTNSISISPFPNSTPKVMSAPKVINNNILQQNPISHVFLRNHFYWALLIFFGFGLLLTFTPCVLPMIPILSGIIVGHGNHIATKKAFLLSLTYVLSMAVTFAFAGVIVALLGNNLQTALQTPIILILFSLLFVVLALSLFGVYELKLPNAIEQKLNHLSQTQKAGNYIGVAIMGCLATLIVSPCVSAPLVGALAYIAHTGNILFGAMALFMMGLGMGLPLLIIGTSLGKILPKNNAWMDNIKIIFGILMLAVAIWLIARVIPANITMFLWGCLVILTAVYLGIFSWKVKFFWKRLSQAFGIIFLIYGGMLLIGAGMGNSDLLQPLAVNFSKNINTSKLPFVRVKTLTDVQKQIEFATSAGKPVILDFYADWCVACKEMEKTTFSNKKIKRALANYVLLRVDVTANDVETKALEKYYNVIAPPYILFFDKNGNEVLSKRVIGEIAAHELLQRVQD